MQGIIEDLIADFTDKKIKLTLEIKDIKQMEYLAPLLNQELDIEITKHKEKRSLDANGYCWILCDRIAKEMSKDGKLYSKEDIYKDAVKNYGTFVPFIVTEKALDKFKEIWEKQGLGYQVQETARQDKCVRVNCYYGSSSYNTQEMSRLIESLVESATELGIETKTPEEIESMLKEYENEIKKN